MRKLLSKFLLTFQQITFHLFRVGDTESKHRLQPRYLTADLLLNKLYFPSNYNFSLDENILKDIFLFVLCLVVNVMQPQALTPPDLKFSAVNLAKGSCSIPGTTTAV